MSAVSGATSADSLLETVMRLDRDECADAAAPAGEGAGACSLVGREAGEDALQRLVREGAQTVRVPPPLIHLGRFDSMATPWYVRDSVFILLA
jgi:hypothetical protein